MARTYQEIYEGIGADYIANADVIEKYNLVAGQTFTQQFSASSIEAIVFSVVAFAAWVQEALWDVFRTEINAEMDAKEPHTRDWYRGKATNFLFGVPVIAETDKFNTTGLTDAQIAAAKVIKQAAAVKVATEAGYTILRLKVAGADVNGNLQPVPVPVLTAFNVYMQENAGDAGTLLTVTTGEADLLRTYVDVYFDPRVLSAQGIRLDGTDNAPVQSAANAFLQSIKFNGVFNVREYERALEAVEGVVFAKVTTAASKYGGYTYDTVLAGINAGPINMVRKPDSGYLKLDDLQLNWIANEQ